MHLTTLEERRESGDLITIYKLMKNIEETENFNIKKKRRGQIFEGTQEKLQKGICLKNTKKK